MQGQEWLDLTKEEFVTKYSLEIWEDYEALHHPTSEEEELEYLK
jgi:hypothetical protein